MWEQLAVQVVGAILSNPKVQEGIIEALTELQSKNDLVMNAFLDSATTFIKSVRPK